MVRAVAIAFFLICTSAPVWAVETEPFNPDAPFQQGLSTSLLRSLLNEALDKFEDHIEFMGKLDSGDVKGKQQGRLQFEFYRRASPNQTSMSAQKAGSTSHQKGGNRIGTSDSRCRKIGSTPRSSFRNRYNSSPVLLLPHIHSPATSRAVSGAARDKKPIRQSMCRSCSRAPCVGRYRDRFLLEEP